VVSCLELHDACDDEPETQSVGSTRMIFTCAIMSTSATTKSCMTWEDTFYSPHSTDALPLPISQLTWICTRADKPPLSASGPSHPSPLWAAPAWAQAARRTHMASGSSPTSSHPAVAVALNALIILRPASLFWLAHPLPYRHHCL
jgi:hypothetical protein